MADPLLHPAPSSPESGPNIGAPLPFTPETVLLTTALAPHTPPPPPPPPPPSLPP
ncbi:MAG: energy transducer TonB, partial [Magnetococcales bacterium]|nr:energy transducer TonB [Magnetococcales bacterium]